MSNGRSNDRKKLHVCDVSGGQQKFKHRNEHVPIASITRAGLMYSIASEKSQKKPTEVTPYQLYQADADTICLLI